MLCPKCGYITFDKLDTCPKCRKDLAGITDKIGGGLSSVSSFCFLGKVIGEGEGKAGAKGNEASLRTKTPPASPGADSAQDSSIDFSLDGLPEIDLSGLGAGGLSEGADVLDIDLSSDREGVVKTAQSAAEPAAAARRPPPAEGRSGLDLNDIDLSDLVVQESEGGGEEALDLGLSDLEIGIQGDGSDSIDLNLDDEEDGLNLSLDLEPESPPSAGKKKDAAIPDLGLSLDLDE